MQRLRPPQLRSITLRTACLFYLGQMRPTLITSRRCPFTQPLRAAAETTSGGLYTGMSSARDSGTQNIWTCDNAVPDTLEWTSPPSRSHTAVPLLEGSGGLHCQVPSAWLGMRADWWVRGCDSTLPCNSCTCSRSVGNELEGGLCSPGSQMWPCVPNIRCSGCGPRLRERKYLAPQLHRAGTSQK